MLHQISFDCITAWIYAHCMHGSAGAYAFHQDIMSLYFFKDDENKAKKVPIHMRLVEKYSVSLSN